jgi:protein SCO1/2
MRLPVLLSAVLLAACGPSADDLETFQTVPDFTLTAQNGEEFRSSETLAGRIWIADFIFTTCTGPCPRMSARMRRLQEELAEVSDLRFVSFTVDPDNDTPEVLAEYAKRYQAEEGRWYFLTGPMEKLHELNREAFLLGDVKGNLDHSTRFVLVDPNGAVRGYYVSADDESMEKLRHDVQLLAGAS